MEILRMDFEVAPSSESPPVERHYIANYTPADLEAVIDAWNGVENYFTFADDGCGIGYMIDPKLDDPPVLLHDFETEEIRSICPRFSEFMHWPRLEIKEE